MRALLKTMVQAPEFFGTPAPAQEASAGQPAKLASQ
jgi:hypothetical protein